MKRFPIFGKFFVLFLCYLGDALASRRFCEEYTEITSVRGKWFLFLLPFGRTAIDIACTAHPVIYLIYRMAQDVLFAILVLALFQAELWKKIFVLSLLIAARSLLWDFAGSFLCSITLFLHHMVKGEPEPVIQFWWEDWIISVLTYAIMILVLYRLAGHRLSFMEAVSGRRYAVLSVPFLGLGIANDIAGQAASRGILLRSGGNWGLYYDQLFSYAGNCIFTGLSMAAAWFYIAGVDRVYLEQKKKERYYAGITAYKAMEKQYRQMERLRHDMKNHLIGMQGMLKNREWDKLEQYLGRMLEAGAVTVDEEATGSRALDALFYDKQRLAREKNIIWECDVRPLKLNGIDEFDLCVLFGNILDNAIEACEKLQGGKTRFIAVKAKMVKKCFLLEVRNSADLENIAEIRHTRKDNPQIHGIGLKNVEDIVQRFHGILEMEIGDGVFSVSILLPLVT